MTAQDIVLAVVAAVFVGMALGMLLARWVLRQKIDGYTTPRQRRKIDT